MRIWPAIFGTALSILTALCSIPAEAGIDTTRRVYQTSDGVVLVTGDYIRSEKGSYPVALLIHQLSRDSRDYQSMLGALLSQGFAVVTCDLRGHGQSIRTSSNSPISFKQFSQGDWAKLPSDIELIINGFKDIPKLDANRVVIVGASIGGNTAAIVGGSDKRVKAEVLLSPGLDYHKLEPAQAMRAGQRPTWMIASKGDQYSANSVQQLQTLDPKHFQVELIEGKTHGTEMLTADMNKRIAAWLHSQLGAAK